MPAAEMQDITKEINLGLRRKRVSLWNKEERYQPLDWDPNPNVALDHIV